MDSQTGEHPKERYPIYFEKFLQKMRLPAWVAGPALALTMGIRICRVGHCCGVIHLGTVQCGSGALDLYHFSTYPYGVDQKQERCSVPESIAGRCS